MRRSLDLQQANLLYQVVGSSPRSTSIRMPSPTWNSGTIAYQESDRIFSELSNETAGEHFTPREVIRLMVKFLPLFAEDNDVLYDARNGGASLFDPACGTGGMLSMCEDDLRQLNPHAQLEVYVKS